MTWIGRLFRAFGRKVICTCTDPMRCPAFGERASGGPIGPGSAYWIGEHGPEPLVMPYGVQPIDLSKYGDDVQVTLDNSDAVLKPIEGLKEVSISYSGFWDDGKVWPWPQSSNPIKVTWQVPANRFHAWLWRLSTKRGLGWIKPRMLTRKFTGHVEPWNDGNGFAIRANPEETAK